MTRIVPPELAEAIGERVVRPFLALHIAFPDPVYAWTGRGVINFDGHEWSGIHGIGAIDTIGEGTDGSSVGVKATLCEVPANFAEDIADQAVRGCAFELYLGALDETFQNIVGHTLVWRGRLAGYEIVDAGESLSVSATGESRQFDQRRPSIKRLSNEYQQRKYPGDRALEYMPRTAEIPILWGKANQSG